MKIRELKFYKDAPSNFDLKNEQQFIYYYGLFNCKRLKAKSGKEILEIMRNAYPAEEFSFEQVSFMDEMSNKEVLVYLCHSHEDRPDIFVYPEDNTPFTVECFV
jgi:hypothetical protein